MLRIDNRVVAVVESLSKTCGAGEIHSWANPEFRVPCFQLCDGCLHPVIIYDALTHALAVRSWGSDSASLCFTCQKG